MDTDTQVTASINSNIKNLSIIIAGIGIAAYAGILGHFLLAKTSFGFPEIAIPGFIYGLFTGLFLIFVYPLEKITRLKKFLMWLVASVASWMIGF